MTEKFSLINEVSSHAIQFLSDTLKGSKLLIDFLGSVDAYIIGSTVVKMFRIQHPELKQMVEEPRTLDIVVTSMDDYTHLCSGLKKVGYKKNMYPLIRWINTTSSSHYLKDSKTVNVILFTSNKIADVLAKDNLSITQCAYSVKRNEFTVGQRALLNTVYVQGECYNSVDSFKNTIFRLRKYAKYGFDPVYPSIVWFSESINVNTFDGYGASSRFIKCNYKLVQTSNGVKLAHKSVPTTNPDQEVTASKPEPAVTVTATASDTSAQVLEGLAELRAAVKEIRTASDPSVSALVEENNKLKNELDDYAVLMKQIEGVIAPHIREECNAQLVEVQAELESTKELYSDIFSRHQAKCKDSKYYYDESVKAIDRAAVAEGSLVKLKSQYEVAQKDIQEFGNKLAEAAKVRDEALIELTEANTRRNASKIANEILRTSMNVLDGRLSTVKAEKADLLDQFLELEKENEELNSRLSSSQTDNVVHESHKMDLQKKIDEMQAQLNAKSIALELSQKIAEQHKKKLAESNERYNSLKKTICTLVEQAN